MHVVLGIGMAAGLVLWLAGQRVVRPMFALVGVVFGASLGFFLAPLLAIEPVRDIPTPYLGLAVGGLIGLAASVTLFRFAMALTAGIVLALAGIMGTSVYLDHMAPIANTKPAAEVSPVSDAPPLAPEHHDVDAPGETSPDTAAVARQAAERTREFLDRAGASARARWDRVPEEHRLMVAGAGVCGGMMGFLLGVFVPRRASALVTALFGSALWLACAAWVAHATSAPGLAFLDQPAQVWLVIWPATAALGILIQWIGIVRAKKTDG